MMKKIFSCILVLSVLMGCSKDPVITNDMLDGDLIFDPSLYNPQEFLVSYAIPNPTPEQALMPVIITSHGYTATTFEWNEFVEFAGSRDVLVSQILLNGHGRTYNDFKNSTWRDWQRSLIEEYERLVQQGYQNIHFLGSSTSGALLMELIAADYFKNRVTPGQFLLVDPIVIPSNKSLSLIHVFGPMLGFLEEDQTAEEDKVFYHFRPQETLRELQDLLNKVRKELEKGVVLPQGSSLKVYKSIQDPTADPVSAVLIYKGLKMADGSPVDLEMVESGLHVFTRLELRDPTNNDRLNQLATFNDIISRVSNN